MDRKLMEEVIGLYNNIKEHFTIYNEENGLPNNAINSIVADNTGKLWVSTLKRNVMF